MADGGRRLLNGRGDELEEQVQHAVDMGIRAFNEDRLEEASRWFRDAAAHADTMRAEIRAVHTREVEKDLGRW